MYEYWLKYHEFEKFSPFQKSWRFQKLTGNPVYVSYARNFFGY